MFRSEESDNRTILNNLRFGLGLEESILPKKSKAPENSQKFQ